VQVNTLAAFDGEPTVGWPNVVHGAPVLASEGRALPTALPWDDDDPIPLVLVSFSTVPEQRSAESLQRVLDALTDLPVHVVATTGGIVDPEELDAPANAYVVAFADHDALLDRAALVVGHGGHGTTMRALRAGIPIVGMPAQGTDQATTLQLLDSWHAGRFLPSGSDVAQIRAAVTEVLGDASYRETAARLSRAFDGADGAARAADAVDAVLVGASIQGGRASGSSVRRRDG
jgi:MGT family glycosyltransferase